VIDEWTFVVRLKAMGAIATFWAPWHFGIGPFVSVATISPAKRNYMHLFQDQRIVVASRATKSSVWRGIEYTIIDRLILAAQRPSPAFDEAIADFIGQLFIITRRWAADIER
jgi:hypothetical protein